MKELKDYIHLYIGCELIGKLHGKPTKGLLTGISGEYEAEIQFFEEDGINVFEYPEYNDFEKVKLILRPLSDMTEEEKLFVYNFDIWLGGMSVNESLPINAEITYFLLSKHFDIFGLIPAGLAIDKTTLK